jgi:hypothetical protein
MAAEMSSAIPTIGRLAACKICGELLPRPQSGRPRLTCFPPANCGRIWANSKRRASRGRAAALKHLDKAAAAANEIDPLWSRIVKLAKWVERQDPCDLADVMERDREQFAPDTVCTWPDSAL